MAKERLQCRYESLGEKSVEFIGRAGIKFLGRVSALGKQQMGRRNRFKADKLRF